jgi:hypothetical protein
MNTNKILMATAAAALFLAGPVSALAADDAAKVKCEGANACKGKTACKSEANACAGKNACKGKGFTMVSEAECEEAKAAEEKGE